jgi:peptide/nickel transport system permease protein
VGAQRYLARKVLYALLTLLFVLVANFAMFRLMPGDPVELLVRSNRLTEQDQIDLRESLGLCVPPEGQQSCTFLQELTTLPDYIWSTMTGHLGVSLRSAVPVTELIMDALPQTILLIGLGTIFSTVFGILIGIRGGWRRGSTFDTTSLYGSLIFYSMPEGWLGMILLIIFSGTLGWFPSGGYQSSAGLTGWEHVVDVANHLFLPCLTLTLGYIGEYAIIMRSSLIEVMNEDFVLTARAKGVQDRLVRKRHAVPNAFLPTFTLIFLSFGFVLGGAIIIETVFSWPGIGLLTYNAIGEQDYPVIQGVFLLSSATVILFNLIADVTYGYLDPRIRQA